MRAVFLGFLKNALIGGLSVKMFKDVIRVQSLSWRMILAREPFLENDPGPGRLQQKKMSIQRINVIFTLNTLLVYRRENKLSLKIFMIFTGIFYYT